MAKIKIKDLNPKIKISKNEMKKVFGGKSKARVKRISLRFTTVRKSGKRDWGREMARWY